MCMSLIINKYINKWIHYLISPHENFLTCRISLFVMNSLAVLNDQFSWPNERRRLRHCFTALSITCWSMEALSILSLFSCCKPSEEHQIGWELKILYMYCTDDGMKHVVSRLIEQIHHILETSTSLSDGISCEEYLRTANRQHKKIFVL